MGCVAVESGTGRLQTNVAFCIRIPRRLAPHIGAGVVFDSGGQLQLPTGDDHFWAHGVLCRNVGFFTTRQPPRRLHQVSADEFSQLPLVVGIPTLFTVHGGTIRLWPTPDTSVDADTIHIQIG